MTLLTKQEWKQYCQSELAKVTPLISEHGYTLVEDQPHLRGERFLQQAVTTESGRKLILLGRNKDGDKVVIKASSESAGKRELKHERQCRQLLRNINFAGEVFHTPVELDFIDTKGLVISVQHFIEQSSPFLERPITEQFTLALKAFKAQESAHATTYKHRKLISQTYHIRNADAYLEAFAAFSKRINDELPEKIKLHGLLQKALGFLEQYQTTIEQYCGFLTHTDFVPHNFRIKDDTIYLLDHSSLTFGNKYEGWARFLNFMTLYNQPLEQAFLQYVKNNRAEEEQLSLKLMRIYRLGEIIWYYTDKLKSSEGNLLELNKSRVDFWGDVLTCILKDETVPNEVITNYQTKRDGLRSNDEKARQKGLH